MSLFGKLKTAVMGNPVTREFELGKHVASAGPGLLWKVHNGVKKTSRQVVSIFVFDKKSPELEKLSKKQKEALYEMLKKGPINLIKLRHPQLLTVEHQVEESGDSLAFVSEPVLASVANLLGHYDNMPSPLPLVIKEHQLHPIEVQYGLMQVAEALNFLHSDVKMMHGNLTQQTVVVNAQGAWKLMGFNFCCYSQYQSEAQTSFAFREWDVRKPVYTNPSLDYLAPEYILTKSCSPLSDIYSYGMLSYAVYDGGRPLFENNNNMLSFKQNVEQISRITEAALGRVPDEFKPLVRSMLAVEPSVRPDALQIIKHPFFEEVAVSTLKYLDSLYEKKDMEKSQFFKKNLARVITKFPKRVVFQRVLPPLSDEFRNNKMIPFVLPLVLLIAEDCTLLEYSSFIQPVISSAMLIQDPIQIPLIFLQKMDLLLKMTPQDEVQRTVLPMITKSLEAEHNQLQELCVNILPSFASMVDYSSMKHSIVPRITSLCIQSRETSLLVKCLVCLGQLLDILDKHIVLDQVLPILHQIPSREPGVLMAILGIFHQILTKPKLGLDKKLLAETVVPYLLPLSIEPSLNLKQFNQFMKVIREMLVKVETEQQAHLDQLSKMEEQTKSTVEFAKEVSEVKAMDDAINNIEGMITGTDPREVSLAPRRGDATKSGSFTNPSSGSNSESTDLLSGLNLGEIFPSKSSPSSSYGSTQPSVISTNQSSLIPASLQPTKAGYHPPTLLQSQKVENLSSANSPSGPTGNTGLMSTGGNLPAKPGSTWSTDFFDDSFGSTKSKLLNSAALVPTNNNHDASSIFSGITSNSQPTNRNVPGNGGVFGGMALDRPLSNSMPRRGKLSQQNADMSSTSGGLSQPLVPTQSGGQPTYLNTINTGWSSDIQTQSGTRIGYGENMNMASSQNSHRLQVQANQMEKLGWSSNIGMGSRGNTGMGSRNVDSNSVSMWSEGTSNRQSSMGQQYGNSTGMSQPYSQSVSNMGMGQQYGNSMGMSQQQYGNSMGMSQQQYGNSMGISQQQYSQSGSNMGMGQQYGTNMGVSQQQYSQSGSNMGMGQQHGQTGNVGMNQSGSNMGMGQQYGQTGNNMAINQQQYSQSGFSMGMAQGQLNSSGMNWSPSIQPQQNIQPIETATLMMGGRPSISAVVGVSSGHGHNSNAPAPGANPFADLSFLS